MAPENNISYLCTHFQFSVYLPQEYILKAPRVQLRDKIESVGTKSKQSNYFHKILSLNYNFNKKIYK